MLELEGATGAGKLLAEDYQMFPCVRFKEASEAPITGLMSAKPELEAAVTRRIMQCHALSVFSYRYT
jgi:hypothetical protein